MADKEEEIRIEVEKQLAFIQKDKQDKASRKRRLCFGCRPILAWMSPPNQANTRVPLSLIVFNTDTSMTRCPKSRRVEHTCF